MGEITRYVKGDRRRISLLGDGPRISRSYVDPRDRVGIVDQTVPDRCAVEYRGFAGRVGYITAHPVAGMAPFIDALVLVKPQPGVIGGRVEYPVDVIAGIDITRITGYCPGVYEVVAVGVLHIEVIDIIGR